MDRTKLPGEDQRGHGVALSKGGREPKELHRLKLGYDNPGSAISTLSQKMKNKRPLRLLASSLKVSHKFPRRYEYLTVSLFHLTHKQQIRPEFQNYIFEERTGGRLTRQRERVTLHQHAYWEPSPVKAGDSKCTKSPSLRNNFALFTKCA